MAKRTTRTKMGPRFCEGSRLLWLALERLGWSHSDLMRKLTGPTGKPLSNGRVDSWLYGDSKPDRGPAAQLKMMLDIPMESWDQSPNEPFVLPAAREAA